MTNVSVKTSVLHLIDTGGPGGAETVFAIMASRICKGSVRPVTVLPKEGWLSGFARSLGLDPRIIPARGTLNAAYLSKLFRIVRKNDIRIVHTHLLGSAVYGALVGLIAGVPVISVMHGPTDLKAPGRFVFAKRWLLNHGCSSIVAVSSSTHDALLHFGIDARLIRLIQNGVDTTIYRPGSRDDIRREMGLSSSDLLVGAVGNIRAAKAYEVLIRSAALVVKKLPNVFFAVIGDGNETQLSPLVKLVFDLGIEKHFKFLGFRKNTSELFQNLDVFVSSSRTEGLSLSFLEAMATGRAIVATRSGGAQEAVDSENCGVLVPIEDPPALAEGLERVLTQHQFREALGVAARARVVANFSIESTISQYEQLYEELLPTSPA